MYRVGVEEINEHCSLYYLRIKGWDTRTGRCIYAYTVVIAEGRGCAGYIRSSSRIHIYSIISTPIYIYIRIIPHDAVYGGGAAAVEEQTNQRQNCFRIYRDRTKRFSLKLESGHDESITHALLCIHIHRIYDYDIILLYVMLYTFTWVCLSSHCRRRRR